VVPASAAKQASPASLTALAGSGKGLWRSKSGKTIAALRDEWNR